MKSMFISIGKIGKLLAVIAGLLMVVDAIGASYDVNYYYGKLANASNEKIIAIGDNYMQRDSLLPALATYSVIIARYNGKEKDVKQEEATYAYNCSGIINFHLASYDRSYACFANALKLASSDQLAATYSNLASLYFVYKDYDTALKYVDKSFNMSLKQKNYAQLCSSFSNIIAIYFAEQKRKEIEPYLNRFLKCNNPKPDIGWLYKRNRNWRGEADQERRQRCQSLFRQGFEYVFGGREKGREECRRKHFSHAAHHQYIRLSLHGLWDDERLQRMHWIHYEGI